MLRRGERTTESIIQDLALRIKNLERAATRRQLPTNYEFIEVAGQLLIRRISDGATVVVL